MEFAPLSTETLGLWLAMSLFLMLLAILQMRNSRLLKRERVAEIQADREDKLERLLKLVERNAKGAAALTNRPVSRLKTVPLARSRPAVIAKKPRNGQKWA